MDLEARNVLVLGMGESGRSMTRWAARRGAARVRVADSRATPPGLDVIRREVPQAEVRTGAFDRTTFADIDLVAISPGVPLATPAVQDALARGLPVVGDVELFAQALPAMYAGRARPAVIGVTGTNGKTTVTALAGAVVNASGRSCAVAGNISPAVLDALMSAEDAGALPDAWALELSSYQLETTHTLACDAATVLNLSEDHLDRYAGMADYAAAKARIFAGSGLQVLNRDDAATLAMHRPGRARVTFGLDAPRGDDGYGLVRDDARFVLARGGEAILPADELQLAGLHNAANALAVLALTDPLGLPRDRTREALRAFRGLPHRVEPIATIAGVRYCNDSKGTNVGATVAALTGFARQFEGTAARVVLIAGGDGKGQDFTPLAAPVARVARAVVLIGRDGPAVGRAVAATGVRIEHATAMTDAIEVARTLARAGDVVLLSPACASFDMFDHYRHRGEVFAATVRALAVDGEDR